MDDILWLCVMNGDIIERLIGDDVLRFTGDVVIGITSLEKRINLKKGGGCILTFSFVYKFERIAIAILT